MLNITAAVVSVNKGDFLLSSTEDKHFFGT